MRLVTDTATSVQGVKMAEMWLKYHEPGKDWPIKVSWYWGKSGTGKTRKAMELMTDPWISGKTLRWWEGYDGHENVIFDDFRKDFCTFHELLRLLDRYPYRVEVKGTSRQLRCKWIIITSCYPPTRIYDTREDILQLTRRLHEVIEFKTDTEVLTQRSGVILDPDPNQNIREIEAEIRRRFPKKIED